MPHKKIRQKVIEEIVSFAEKEQIPIMCMRVAGSMAYANREHVTAASDIDLDIL